VPNVKLSKDSEGYKLEFGAAFSQFDPTIDCNSRDRTTELVVVYEDKSERITDIPFTSVVKFKCSDVPIVPFILKPIESYAN
jgi:hypothetical protein